MGFEHQAVGFIAALVRTAAWAHSAPFIGDRVIPARVRMAVVLPTALAIASVRPASPDDALFLMLPGELLFGLVLGFSTRIIVSGIEAGGQLIGHELGLAFASQIDPTIGEEALPTRRIAYALAGIAFIAAGGFESAVRALAIPPFSAPSVMALVPSMIEQGGLVFDAAIRLAAPMLLASVISNLTMAIASRAAPALNVFSVMLALFLVVGIAVLLATAPIFVAELDGMTRLAADAARRVVER
ncbi:flagellar biosynthetic protein FliR [Myxococcota bacterium]|nr:flagellar biosynthetic protein FliR [Myxococcota bacterium]